MRNASENLGSGIGSHFSAPGHGEAVVWAACEQVAKGQIDERTAIERIPAEELGALASRRLFPAAAPAPVRDEADSSDPATRDESCGGPAWRDAQVDRLLEWAHRCRRLAVLADVSSAFEAGQARVLGAEGIGVFRTESMFHRPEFAAFARQLARATALPERRAAAAALLAPCREEFVAALTQMQGWPVSVRLFSGTLYDWLPHTEVQQRQVAADSPAPTRHLREELADFVENMRQANPLLGTRGIRLLLSRPEILVMQVQALLEAAMLCRARGVDARPQILVPFLCEPRELCVARQWIDSVVFNTCGRQSVRESWWLPVGAELATPRAVLKSAAIARMADFLVFETDQLTQCTFGVSRVDCGTFWPTYLQQRLLAEDPFETLDVPGVGRLMAEAIEAVAQRSSGGHPSWGLCGEHGGDPASIAFAERLGLDFLSCAPNRLPLAALAAARASIRTERAKLPPT